MSSNSEPEAQTLANLPPADETEEPMTNLWKPANIRIFPSLNIDAKAIVGGVVNISAACALLTRGPLRAIGTKLRIVLEVATYPLIELLPPSAPRMAGMADEEIRSSGELTAVKAWRTTSTSPATL